MFEVGATGIEEEEELGSAWMKYGKNDFHKAILVFNLKNV
jgi:hypothetical protein